MMVNSRNSQSGVMLVEALIGMLVFSVGILALVYMQGAAIKNGAQSKSRSDAALLANELIARVWVDAPANVASYAHRPGGAACAPTGADSGHARVTGWLASIAAVLPGAAADIQQIVVGANNIITVRICWQAPGEPSPHNYVARAQVRQ